jgi:predicted nucleic acid-binding protein
VLAVCVARAGLRALVSADSGFANIPEIPHVVPDRDPDDDLILACAEDAGVQIIVSGDRRHLLPIAEHRGVRIVTPQALLADLANV